MPRVGGDKQGGGGAGRRIRVETRGGVSRSDVIDVTTDEQSETVYRWPVLR